MSDAFYNALCDHQHFEGYEEGYKDGYEAGKRGAASRWRRVEEELPPKGFALIGARKRPPEISEDIWDMLVCEYDGEWGWQNMDGFALRGITHWMPIEPPKEDVDGNK